MYKESIKAIMEANKEDPELLDFVEERVNTFVEYVAHVTFEETRIQRLTIEGVDGEEWRDQVQKLDERRRDKHENAMNAAKQLNRLAAASGLEPFYDAPIDHEHRNEVGDMCQAVVNEYFEGRNTRSLTIADMMGEEKETKQEDTAFADAVAELSERKAEELTQ